MSTNNYPVLDPVADEAAQKRLEIDVAPAVALGTLIDDDIVEAATREHKRRKFEHKFGAVSQSEVNAASRRELALRIENVMESYPVSADAAPAWFVSAIAAATQPTIDAIAATNRGIEALRQEVQELHQDVQHLRREMQLQHIGLENQLTNQTRLWAGRAASTRALNATAVQTPLNVLVKEHAGLGAPLPNAQPLRPNEVDVKVGQDIPSPPFPATIRAIGRMTLSDINYLAMLMHEHFGIVAGDDLRSRRGKVRIYFES